MSAFPHRVKVHLSPLQEKKLSTGKPIQLKHCNLGEGRFEICLSIQQVKKAEKAHIEGKGMRIQFNANQIKHHLDNGFFNKLKDEFTKVPDQAKKAINISKQMTETAIQPIRETLGVGMPTRRRGRPMKGVMHTMDEVFDPTREGGSLKSIGRQMRRGLKKFFTRTVPSALIHQGIPAVSSAIGSALGTATTGNPLGTAIGAKTGNILGNQLADYVGNETGYGFGGGALNPAGYGLKKSSKSKAKRTMRILPINPDKTVHYVAPVPAFYEPYSAKDSLVDLKDRWGR